MKDKKYILFDLDGTLTDPSLGITNSVMYAFEKFGIEIEDRSELYRFIGPPLINAFMDYYGFSKEDALKALSYYREYFSVKGIFENRLYDGIFELLKKLKADGKKIILATSKPQEFAERILEFFGVLDFFYFVGGATMDESRSEKDDIIEYVLNECDISTDNAVMVGDRKYDILGAHKFHIKAIGVTYGFGSVKELETAGADAIAHSVAELEKKIYNI